MLTYTYDHTLNILIVQQNLIHVQLPKPDAKRIVQNRLNEELKHEDWDGKPNFRGELLRELIDKIEKAERCTSNNP